jgi:hypothetical protein
MPVALVPADEGIERRIAEVGRALVKIEVATYLNCPVQQRQGQSGKASMSTSTALRP